MQVRRLAPQTETIDILDRVLDKGIVIDAWLKISVAGIEVVGVDVRVIVASIETYLRMSETLATTTNGAAPKASLPQPSPAQPALTTPRRTPARRRPTVRRRVRAVRRRALVTRRCAQGCTFTRPAHRAPRSVRCPYDAGRVCDLAAA